MWVKMSEGFLSQEEIDSLLKMNEEVNKPAAQPAFGDTERDILGEVGNITMSTSATTLSTLLNRQVDITTPRVHVTTVAQLLESFASPYIILQVQFEEGLHGTNVLIMGIKDASIIANLMMGGDGSNYNTESLSELELSAISEAMNQMIGSASTAVSTMLGKKVDIDPPITQIWDNKERSEFKGIDSNQDVVNIVFKLTIEGLVDSEIMQLYEFETAREIVDTMLGGLNATPQKPKEAPVEQPKAVQAEKPVEPQPQAEPPRQEPRYEAPAEYERTVQVHKPEFVPFNETPRQNQPRNIDLILDVPMEMSVVLGQAQRSIKQILALEPGSIVELNKYAEEPLDIYVNGKLIGQGEVVVVDEKFGIRVNSIVSARERAETLK